MDLCESCAKQHGIGDPPSFSLAELLHKTSLFAEDPTTETTCPSCGFSPSSPQFKKMGRLGCPRCYEHFHAMLGAVLKDLHPHAVHQGKVPQNLFGKQATRERIRQLEQEMQQVIKSEDYEKAALLRDNITKLKQSLRGAKETSETP